MGEGGDRARALFQALPQPATLIDRRGVITDVNEAFIAMARDVGRPIQSGDRVGFPVERFAADASAAESIVALTRELLSAGVRVERQWEMSAPDGSTRCLRLTGSPLRGRDGEVTGGLLQWEDLGGQTWEARQRRSRERLRQELWSLRSRESVPAVLRSLLRSLQEQFPQLGNCSVQVRESDTGAWTTYGVSAERYSEHEQRHPGRAVEECWSEQQPVYRADLRRDDPYGEGAALWPRMPGLRSVLDVPFFQGTLGVNSTTPDAFSERDIAALTDLAHVLSEGLSQLAEVRSGARYRALVETPQNQVVMYLNLEGYCLYVGPQVEATTGYGPQDFYDDPSLRERLAHPDDHALAEAAYRRVASGGPAQRLEVRWRHCDGGYRTGLETVSPIRGEGGRLEAVQLVFQDITDRVQIEQELRTSLSLLHASLDSTVDGILIVDRAGRIARWNRRFKEMWGVPDEILDAGDDDAAIAHVLSQLEDPDQFVAKVRELYAHPGDSSFDRLEFSDGRTYERYSQPQRLGDEVVGRVWSFRDISERLRGEEERQKLEQQIQQTQRLESLGVLAGGIAHDFNNILTPVLGQAQLALMDLPPASTARASIEEIEKAARHAAVLCRQMLAYSGSASFTLERVDLVELVEDMVHLLNASIVKKAVLRLDLAAGLPPVSADAGQIRQIIMNLVINASEALGEEAGVIAVRLSAATCDRPYLQSCMLGEELEPGPYVKLEVADTGEGMDGDTLDRIFDPFYTTKFTGRGLGLAAVLGIVRSHRGAIAVESEPGRGTRFCVVLPALGDAPSSPPAPEEAAPVEWRASGTVLLADDEAPVLAVARSLLERLGCAVVTAADGAEAVEVYRQRGPEIDLVLLDLTMPRLDGAEAYEALRRLDPEVQVALASGYSEEDVAGRFAGKPLAGVVEKPYSVRTLRDLLAGAGLEA